MSTNKPIVLLGAGASIDAGLPSSLALTPKIFEYLKHHRSPEAQLFAYVISKLIVRNVRQGGSPFTPIDVETAYEAIKSFINKDTSLLAEFSSGWDPAPGQPGTAPVFRRGEFERNLQALLIVKRGRSLRTPDLPTYTMDHNASSRLARQLEKAINIPDQKHNLSSYIEALVHFLTPEAKSYEYLDRLCEHASSHFDCIATLNYDLLIEKSCKSRDISFDYGLRNWNLRRYVRFYKNEIDIIKLHGSLNWFFKNEDDIEVADEPKSYWRRGLIFGGQSEKLFSDGPFLALRQNLFDRMRLSNVLVIAGYSFSDNHINAMLRSWAATRRKAKLIIVNPSLDEKVLPVLGKCQRRDKDGNSKNFVQLKLFRSGLASSISDVVTESLTPVDLSDTDYTAELKKELTVTGSLSEWARAQQ